MTPWDEQLRELREQFFAGGPGRCEEIRILLARLVNAPSDGETLKDLMRAFHRLAGSGGTFGFSQVAQIGHLGEEEIDHLLRSGGQPSPDHFARWRAYLSQLEAEFSGEPGKFAPSEGAPSPSSSEPVTRPFDLLVVEDDEEFGGAMERFLQDLGMGVRWVRSKGEAEKTLSERTPDALIADILLEDGSGYELVRWFRERSEGERPVILVVSVLSAFFDKVEAVHCGADGYFVKPLNWEEFSRRLDLLLMRTREAPPKVMSVEDDPAEGAFIATVLEAAGYEVHLCRDPALFEADIASYKPDLLLMDVVLPGYSGFDLVRYLRQNETYLTLPVIFLTTQSQVKHKISALKAGGDDYLVKPVSPSLLISSVAAHLEKARLLKRVVGRDGLTGLLSHSAFMERAGAAFSKRDRPQVKPTALVLLDLDHFKTINDTYGHLTGDKVLVALSALFRKRLRQSDVIGRYGGEEFSLILEDLNAEEVGRLLGRLGKEFSEEEFTGPDGAPFHVTFSAGVAMLSPALATLESWREASDMALYDAKRSGRNLVRVAPEA